MTTPANPHAVDVHALPAMLTALRLPSIHRHWPTLAERADQGERANATGPSEPANGPPPASWPRSPNSRSPSARHGASAVT